MWPNLNCGDKLLYWYKTQIVVKRKFWQNWNCDKTKIVTKQEVVKCLAKKNLTNGQKVAYCDLAMFTLIFDIQPLLYSRWNSLSLGSPPRYKDDPPPTSGQFHSDLQTMRTSAILLLISPCTIAWMAQPNCTTRGKTKYKLN